MVNFYCIPQFRLYLLCANPTERSEPLPLTIYDIAREAGVSASTVSRVVNNKPGISVKTRQKVLALLDRYHYVPNEAARGLVTSSSRLVGIFIADIRSQHHVQGAYYIANELSKLNYCSLILNTGANDDERVAGIRMLEQRKVEAAVLMGSVFQTKTAETAIRQYLPNVPVFMLNGFINLPNVYGVLSDERTGVAECVALLSKKNKKRIVFMADNPTPSTKLKTQGFWDGVRQLGLSKKDAWLYTNVDGTLDGGYSTMCRALQEHPSLDGVICSLDIIACGALRALQDTGIAVPKQVGVIGIDNSIYADICTPRLTSLDNMLLDSSITIAHKLVDRLEGLSTNQRTLLFTKIVEREST